MSPVEYLTEIPEQLEATAVAPLLCGTPAIQSTWAWLYLTTLIACLTAYSTLAKTNLKKGDRVVLPGAGDGLGHLYVTPSCTADTTCQRV